MVGIFGLIFMVIGGLRMFYLGKKEDIECFRIFGFIMAIIPFIVIAAVYIYVIYFAN